MNYQNIYGSTKLDTFAEIIEGYEDIAQVYGVILGTQQGAVVLEPLFGVDHLRYIDRPLEDIRGQYIADIIEALTLWEPRAQVESVTLSQVDANLIAVVAFKLRDVDIMRTMTYSL